MYAAMLHQRREAFFSRPVREAAKEILQSRLFALVPRREAVEHRAPAQGHQRRELPNDEAVAERGHDRLLQAELNEVRPPGFERLSR